MPLDLALSTNTPTATLELRQAQPLGDGRHHAAFLVVRSGAFAAALPFVFTQDHLATFAESLNALRTTRSGTASLQAGKSDDIIRMESVDEGKLRVCGELHETEGTQRLTFSFAAEWEGLDTFNDGIHRLHAKNVN
ncbi:MAG: hypothetical protein M3Z05_14790 [Gemmatimonadota bacterium]|nr:hypothetical protein [Gemmatimonadota bacterium]